MKTRLMVAFFVFGASIVLGAFPGSVFADPPSMFTDPPNHQHFIVTPNGDVPVGPQICNNQDLQLAFNQFHYNIHHSQVPGVGDVPTLGPQDGAPGLHNDVGAEMKGVPGCP